MSLFENIADIPVLARGQEEQKAILLDFHQAARRLLGSVVSQFGAGESLFRFERNFFSALFLAVQSAVGLSEDKRKFYGFMNQCMRAWVTACDNLLDDEDRYVFPIGIPGEGYRFKSVLSIMASDRIMAERLFQGIASAEFTDVFAQAIQKESLACLLPSGMQEHEEEGGVSEALPPDILLDRIHAIKTGRLFEAPLILPEKMGEIAGESVVLARQGLHTFGLGCRIVDDMADFERDLVESRHNYVVSVRMHSSSGLDLDQLRERVRHGADVSNEFQEAHKQAQCDGEDYIKRGLNMLREANLPLREEHAGLICEGIFPLILGKDNF